jgi:hypothetical protein
MRMIQQLKCHFFLQNEGCGGLGLETNIITAGLSGWHGGCPSGKGVMVLWAGPVADL